MYNAWLGGIVIFLVGILASLGFIFVPQFRLTFRGCCRTDIQVMTTATVKTFWCLSFVELYLICLSSFRIIVSIIVVVMVSSISLPCLIAVVVVVAISVTL